jgi:hypothetical protein
MSKDQGPIPRLERRKFIPTEVRHEWFRNKARGAGVYECPHCHQWTANVPLYFQDICEARDRRKTPDRRRHDD